MHRRCLPSDVTAQALQLADPPRAIALRQPLRSVTQSATSIRAITVIVTFDPDRKVAEYEVRETKL